ncbi:unnamed protein product [Phytophthora lilii]|uniref:Unnamed protein product n=1 Tax=Phytophthora lilii TaxID=2077276 RepID=A0A9W6XB11_9STRA|nr:unnamed protein product [Phytophthora lilii]
MAVPFLVSGAITAQRICGVSHKPVKPHSNKPQGGEPATGQNVTSQNIAEVSGVLPLSESVVHRGYNIGVRLVDEFLAKSGVAACQDFKDTAEVVAKVAFKMFLGINVEVSQWNAEANACSLLIYDNPLTGGRLAGRVRSAVVLERAVRRPAWCPGDGADACGGAVRQGRVAGRRGVGDPVGLRRYFFVVLSMILIVVIGVVDAFRLELRGMIEEAMGDEYKED